MDSVTSIAKTSSKRWFNKRKNKKSFLINSKIVLHQYYFALKSLIIICRSRDHVLEFSYSFNAENSTNFYIFALSYNRSDRF